MRTAGTTDRIGGRTGGTAASEASGITDGVGELLREITPQVLGPVARLFGSGTTPLCAAAPHECPERA